MIQRQKRAILLFCAVVLVLGATLAVLFSTVWKPKDAQSTEEVFLVEPLDMADIAEISVKNREHSWRLYRGEDGELYFEGAEYVLYNQNMIAYLRSCVAYLSSSGEVKDPEPMEEYALTQEDCLCDFSVTDTKGETYRVLVGEKLVGGDGYYARLFDSDEVHVLSNSLERCLFGDVTFFLSGQVATALSENDYYEISRLAIEHEGKPFVEIEKIPEDEVKESDLSTHRVIYPAPYEPNTDLLTRLFKSFVSFVGEDVVEYDLAAMDKKEFARVMQDYGFVSETSAKMYCKVSYDYHDVKTELYVSRVDEEKGLAYVYSPGFDIVAAFDASALAWTQYDLMEYTQSEVFARSIADVKSISVSGEEIECTFTLTHGASAKELVVRSERGEVNTQDFRQFYTQLLYVKNAGYATVPENYEETESLRLTITLTDDSVREFVFYDIETLKSYYTLDGEGVFVVNRDYVKRLLEAAAKLLSGQRVEAVSYA